MKKTIIAILSVLVVITGLTLVGVYTEGTVLPLTIGSIETGQEYTSTTTIHSAVTTNRLIKGGWGALGQVTVTGAGGSAYTLIDATSTESLATDTRISTSTQLLATIPATLVAGNYVYDLTFTKGLFIYFDVIGTHPTSTIIYR